MSNTQRQSDDSLTYYMMVTATSRTKKYKNKRKGHVPFFVWMYNLALIYAEIMVLRSTQQKCIF